MKSKLKIFAAVLAAAAGLTGCYSITGPLEPPGITLSYPFIGRIATFRGSLYQGYKANFNCWHNADGSCVGKDGPKAVGSKTGEACATSILGLILTGDMSLEAAAAAGGISKVASVDYSYTSILVGVMQKSCTIVNGD